jgi:hypothetical protein
MMFLDLFIESPEYVLMCTLLACLTHLYPTDLRTCVSLTFLYVLQTVGSLCSKNCINICISVTRSYK